MIRIIPILLALTISSINIEPEGGKEDRSSSFGLPSRSRSTRPFASKTSQASYMIESGYSIPPFISLNSTPNSGISWTSPSILFPSSSSSLLESSSNIPSSSSISIPTSSSSELQSSSSLKSSSSSHQASSSSILSSSSLSSSSSKASSSKPSSSSIQSSQSSNSSSNEPIISDNGDYLFCDTYGPFYKDESSATSVSFTYELNSISSQRIIERVRLINDGTVVYATTKGSYNYTKGERKTVSFSIPFNSYLTDKGLTILFEIISSSYAVLKGHEAHIYPPSEATLSGYDLKHNIYTSNSLAFYANGDTLHDIKETFDFTKIGDYIDNDSYYRLDISRNYFYYEGIDSFTYRSANLRFNDDDYLFPSLTHQDNGDIVLPLTLVKNNERLSFTFKNKFYVNPKTLETSDSYKPGYIYTADFYLPINGIRRFNNKPLSFELNGMALDEISTVISLKYIADRSLVGECSNGDYCVEGGQ